MRRRFDAGQGIGVRFLHRLNVRLAKLLYQGFVARQQVLEFGITIAKLSPLQIELHKDPDLAFQHSGVDGFHQEIHRTRPHSRGKYATRCRRAPP